MKCGGPASLEGQAIRSAVRTEYSLLVNPHFLFIHSAEEDGAEEDGPDAVSGHFKSDVVLIERVCDEEQLVLQPERAGVGDALHKVMPWVSIGGQARDHAV